MCCGFRLPAQFMKSMSSCGHTFRVALFCLWLRLKCAGAGMYSLCTGLDPAARMSFPALQPLQPSVCEISLMRQLMRNWCLLAAVIFIPSSVSNGTAALVIPLSSSSQCSDDGKIKLQMEKGFSVLQAKLSHLLSLTFLCCFHTPCQPRIIPSQDCLLQGTAAF